MKIGKDLIKWFLRICPRTLQLKLQKKSICHPYTLQPLFTIATFIFNSFINGQRFSQQFLLEISLWKLLLRAKDLTDLFSRFEIIIS